MAMFQRRSASKRRPGTLSEWRRIAANDLWNRHLFMYASALAFNFLLVAIPLAFLLLLSMGQLMPADLVYDKFGELAMRLIEQSGDTPDEVRTVMQSRLKNVLSSISLDRRFVWSVLLFLIVISYYFLSMVRSILNQLWDIQGWQSIVHATLREMLTFGFLGLGVLGTFFIVLSLGLVFQGRVIHPSAVDTWVATLWYLLPVLIPLATAMSSFVLYYFLPSEWPSAHLALSSALIFTVLWELSRYLFGYYVIETFLALDALYGILAIFLTAATWSYYSFLIFTVAAIVARAYDKARRMGTPPLRHDSG